MHQKAEVLLLVKVDLMKYLLMRIGMLEKVAGGACTCKRQIPRMKQLLS